MIYTALKIVISALIIAGISELTKLSSALAALLASLPLVSILAMIWIYVETKDVAAISTLSIDIFWLVLPSLLLFVMLPILLHRKVNFYLALLISISVTIIGYYAMMQFLKKIGH